MKGRRAARFSRAAKQQGEAMSKIKTGAYVPLPAAPMVLVGANVGGKANFAAVGFVGGVNVRPPTVYVGLNRMHHTPKGIVENGTFSLNVPSAGHVAQTDYCGLASGRNEDKSGLFATFYGELGTAPMIEEFALVCECRYVGQKAEFAEDVVYFGEVVQVYVEEFAAKGPGRIDVGAIAPIVFSGFENRYRTLGRDVGEAWSIGRGLSGRG